MMALADVCLGWLILAVVSFVYFINAMRQAPYEPKD